MCFKKKKEERKNIRIPDKSCDFYIRNIDFICQYEKEREASMLEQAGRLLVVESIIAAAYCQIITSFISSEEHINFYNDYFSKICLFVGLLLVLALIVTVLSQHRYWRRGLPVLDNIKNTISSKGDKHDSKVLERDYKQRYIEDMYLSLKKLNDFRGILLIVVMIVLLLIFILVSFAVCMWILGV